MQLKDIPLTVIRERADLLRGMLLLLVFRPAAFICPEPLIWGLAYLCACVVVLQASGRRLMQDFRAAFGVSRRAALAMAVRTHARRFHEFSLQQKIILGWHDPHKLPSFVDTNPEARAVLDGPGSFVLALAHFERTDAAASIFHPTLFGGRPVSSVAFKLPNLVFLPHIWRIGLQLRQVLRATARARPNGLEFVYTGGAVNPLVEKLRQQRIMATVNVDAHWGRGRSSSLTRSFAGANRRTFSTGAAKLARLAGVPLLLAMPVLSNDHLSIRMRLYGPFHSAVLPEEQKDVDVTQQVLDVIECEVGERPCEYLLDIGGDRRWDTATKTWHDVAVVAATTRLTANSG